MLNRVDPSWGVILLDRVTGVQTDLRSGGYTFQATTTAPARESDRPTMAVQRFPGDSADDIRNVNKLRAEGHRRLATPFYAFALAMIALAGVISGEFQRRSRWVRLTSAGAAAVAFELIALGLVPIVTTSPALAPLLYLHVVATIGIAGWIILTPRKRSRVGSHVPEAPK